MDRNEFVTIMTGIAEMYPGRFEKLGDLALEMWYECLSDLDYGMAKRAIGNHVKSSKYPPTVADIREQYLIILDEAEECSLRLRNIFFEIRNSYPSGNEDENAVYVFTEKIKEIEPKKQIEYAKAIRNTVIDYVIRCENGEGELTMTLSECIEWATGDEK